jgi:predicted nucleotidyltransferase
MEVAVQLHYPALAAPFDSALHDAVADILAQFDPVGIVAAGSVLRGAGAPTSDIDLYVIQQAPFRQRLQRRYAGVPCEIFVNPPEMVRRYFEDEHCHGRPITAHMLATGYVVLDRDPVVQTLRNEAEDWLATAPTLGEERLRWLRYLLVDQADNIRDVAATDPTLARLLLGELLPQLATYIFLAAGRHVPRHKDLLADMARLDEAAAVSMRAIVDAPNLSAALLLTVSLMLRILGSTTFFAWDSTPEAIKPND